ncbi:histone-lysine N-methyltransferase SETMAR [Trichonephila clavipes]|nr:histone-lysine N-methyltransferase SETMAR [Trichonephila clavipes]
MNAQCHKSRKSTVKWNEWRFKLLSHPPYSPDFASSEYLLFTDLKRMLQEKRVGLNEKVITEVEAYFESKDKSFYEKGIRRALG